MTSINGEMPTTEPSLNVMDVAAATAATATVTATTAEHIPASAASDIPSFNGDEKAKASDFANYFCSYAQLYHQKTMLQDHARMAAYHAAIRGNADVFRDKVVLDIGTGSGILAVWAAQAGARKVYAIEYTDMAHHARRVVAANHVEHIVTVLQCAVEDVVLPVEQDGLEMEAPLDDDNTDTTVTTDTCRCVDIIVSEWMGYFLLRESMLDSIVRARDKFLKRQTGLLFPSHCTMYVAPVTDEAERRRNAADYEGACDDWHDFCRTTAQVYGVNMNVLTEPHEREQRDYYLLSSRWTELPPDAVLADPVAIKQLDLFTCTIADARGIAAGEANFDFSIYPTHNRISKSNAKPSRRDDNDGYDEDDDDGSMRISGLAGWFTADFRSRTDALGAVTAPTLPHPAYLSTGPDNGYTHWGQQTFYFVQPIVVPRPQTSGRAAAAPPPLRLHGSLELVRTKENARLYNCRIAYQTTTTTSQEEEGNEATEVTSDLKDYIYQIP
jgi:type I protein arginine methyltransferase